MNFIIWTNPRHHISSLLCILMGELMVGVIVVVAIGEAIKIQNLIPVHRLLIKREILSLQQVFEENPSNTAPTPDLPYPTTT